jgi:hypothetical protein
MSVIQEVHTFIGWLVPTFPACEKWAEELDYQLPEGFMFEGMDSNNIAVGVFLFSSGSSRWGPMDGTDKCWTPDEASDLLTTWENQLDEDIKLIFADVISDPPKFYTFINHR